jgi:hypothetical protein
MTNSINIQNGNEGNEKKVFSSSFVDDSFASRTFALSGPLNGTHLMAEREKKLTSRI